MKNYIFKVGGIREVVIAARSENEAYDLMRSSYKSLSIYLLRIV
jgi:hypothetical protein